MINNNIYPLTYIKMTNLLETTAYQNLLEQLRDTESLFRTAMNNWSETNDEKALQLAESLSEECRRLKEEIDKYLQSN